MYEPMILFMIFSQILADWKYYQEVNNMPLTKRERFFTVMIVIMLILFGWMYFKQAGSEQQNEAQLSWSETTASQGKNGEEQAEKPAKASIYVVDVKGAVNSPGVYKVAKGDRVIDVIRDAGGFTKKADQQQINLAGLLKDEMVVYVPVQGETSKQWTAAVPSSSSEEGKINVNTANAAALEELPGIGPAKATAIIAYREEQGPFQTAEDLLEVTGIGEKSLEQLKDSITF
jgi:competence protein ComEA